MQKVSVPPIKSQGIKTKLVPWVKDIVPDDFEGVWIEPFMGTGVVAFNVAPKKALLCDTNPHLINFYTEIQNGYITPEIVRDYLNREGEKLLNIGEEHYYNIRIRFNEKHSPLDFLFLNRAGFNGMIRFNRKGGFNIPFCKKPARFAQAYVTKIVNQVSSVSQILKTKDFNFKCQSFEKTINECTENDLVYCDPPYIGRHTDYYNGWNEESEYLLHSELKSIPGKFILSTWHHNDFRENEYIKTLWNQFNILTREHFYHVGGQEKNRNPMIEALISNYPTLQYQKKKTYEPKQLNLLDSGSNYKVA